VALVGLVALVALAVHLPQPRHRMVREIADA
jgi:hypothetical protein